MNATKFTAPAVISAMRSTLDRTESLIAQLYKRREQIDDELNGLNAQIDRQRELAMHLHGALRVMVPHTENNGAKEELVGELGTVAAARIIEDDGACD